MTLNRKWQGSMVAAVSVAVALALSACSSSSSTNGSNTAAASDYNVAAAKALAAEFTTRPTSVGVTTPITGSVPAGKTIDLVQCGVPACQEAGDYLQSAVQAVGWKLVRINAGLTAETTKAAWDQAVSNKPDGVVTSGSPDSLFKPELAKLAAMNIPVVDQSVNDPQGDGLSLVLLGKAGYEAVGARIADYILAQNNGKAFQTATFYSSGYAGEQNGADAFKSTIMKACPKCTVDSENVPLTSIGSDFPQRVTAFLSAHPKVQWVWPNYSDFVTGLPQALTAASLTSIKLVTWDSNSTSVSYMKNGKGLVAFDAYPAAEMMWRSVDFFIRTFNHESTSVDSSPLPVWFIDNPAQIPSSSTGLFPLVANYQAQFKKLWKLSS